MIGITKEFLGGRIIANDNVDLSIKRNEIHALIGENGSGKSTLMSILFGIYEPTAGQIFYNDEEIEIETPMTAKKLGIGMVHQHYQLVENMSCIENVLLGQEGGWIVPIKSKLRNRVEQKLNKELKDHKKDSKKFKNDATYRFKELVKKYKFNLDPYTKVQELTIGQKQKLEIIKVL
jgi:simple sugar transport system ATP-binding protein